MRVVFSDLDGTVLDGATYSFERSLPQIRRLQENRVPIVFCSSKTRAEMEPVRHEIGVADPFIVENGSAMLLDEGYFPFEVGEEDRGLRRVEMAERLATVTPRLEAVLAAAGIEHRTFAEMTPEEISKDSGLSLEQAANAKKREYTMSLRFPRREEMLRAASAISESGLTCYVGGRYLTVGWGGNKGAAVREMTGLFTKAFGRVTTYAFGDGENDLSMLAAVDVPILVQSSKGVWTETALENVVRIPLVGPEGFVKGVEEVVKPAST